MSCRKDESKEPIVEVRTEDECTANHNAAGPTEPNETTPLTEPEWVKTAPEHTAFNCSSLFYLAVVHCTPLLRIIIKFDSKQFDPFNKEKENVMSFLGGVHWTVLLFCFYSLSEGLLLFVFLLQSLETCLIVSRLKQYQLKTLKLVVRLSVVNSHEAISHYQQENQSLVLFNPYGWCCSYLQEAWCFFPDVSCPSERTSCWCVYGMYPPMSTHSMMPSFVSFSH